MGKLRLGVLGLALCLAFTCGCASLLDREFVSVEPHSEHGGTEDDASIRRADSYSQLLSAVLYFVGQGMEEGEVQLYNYSRDVESDLTAACLAVIQNDPLGAYSVDYIKHDYTRILSYYKVDLSITYRRTKEQVGSIVTATGSSAIRTELVETLATFTGESVLRISSFAEDTAYLEELLRAAYYETPATALGMPAYIINLYPQRGSARIVEFLFTYPEDQTTLSNKSTAVIEAARGLSRNLGGVEDKAAALYAALRERTAYRTDIVGMNTAYAALVEGAADSEGMALAFQLLCDMAGLDCTVVQGRDGTGAPRYWNILTDGDGSRHVDPSRATMERLTDAQMAESGAQWEAEGYPVCGEPTLMPAEENLMDEGNTP